jgi:hypothetical protein
VLTGVGVDLLGARGHKRPHPAVVLLTGVARGVDEAVLPSRLRPRSPEQVDRMVSKYRTSRRSRPGPPSATAACAWASAPCSTGRRTWWGS